MSISSAGVLWIHVFYVLYDLHAGLEALSLGIFWILWWISWWTMISGFLWWISWWTMMDLMMDYDGYSGYMMLRLIYVSLVISSIFPRAWPAGCLGLVLFDELDMKILHWMAWKPNFLLLCFFPTYISVLYACRDYYSQLVMLWVIMLVITSYIFFTYLTWFIRNDEKKSAKIRLDDWWTVMLFMRYFLIVITTLNSW